MRNEIGAKEEWGRGRRGSKGNSLVVTKILERARPRDSGAVYRDGSRNSGTGRGRDDPETNFEMDRFCPCNPGTPFAWRLFLHTRLALDCYSPPHYVYADRRRHRRRVFLLRCCSTRTG